MKVTKTAAERYNPEFPEAGNWWDLIDIASLTKLAEKLSVATWESLRTSHRSETPGLRIALRMVAGLAGVAK